MGTGRGGRYIILAHLYHAEESVEVTPAYSVSPPKGVHAAGSPSPDKHGERRAGYR